MQENLFIAEGSKIVPEIISSGFGSPQVIGTEKWIASNQQILQGIHIEVAEEIELGKISTLSTAPEVIAICTIPAQENPVCEPGKLYLILDAIRDPGNMGTIIRLADWFGVDAIIASEDCVEWSNPKVIQSTMGAFIRIRPTYTDLKSFIESFNPKIPILAADLEGENLYASSFIPEGCLILSSESHGLSTYLESLISRKFHIPRGLNSSGKTESLNVATAAAIFLGEFTRRRAQS